MPPVSTTISSASTTTPMIDICSSRLVRLVPPQNTAPSGDGGDEQQGDQDVEGVLALQPADELATSGGVSPRSGGRGGGAVVLVDHGRSSFARRVGEVVGQSWWVRAVRMRSSVSAWSGSNSPTIWPLRITRMRWHSDSSSSASLETTRTPLPRAATAVDDLVDVGAGADVDALGRLVQDDEVGVGLHPLGDHDLLLVAAAQGAGVGLGAALDLVLPDQLAEPASSPRPASTTPALAILGSTTRLMFWPLSKSLTKPSSRRSSVR